MEMVSKKVPKSSLQKLRVLQARYMLRRHERISEGRLIDKALDELIINEEKRSKENKKFCFSDISGMFSMKRGITDKEIDDVVYGDLR